MKENSKIQVPRINVVSPRAFAASNFESNAIAGAVAEHAMLMSC
jgi:hypothetical protein